MIQDVLGSLLATLVFSLVLYAPGYLLAYAVDLYGFRQMRFKARSGWAIACSFCVVPILAYGTGRICRLDGICYLVILATTGTLILLCKRHNRRTWPWSDGLIVLGVAAGWIIFVLLMLVDLQVGHKLYFSTVMADQSYRIAFTDAIVRTGIPPANPLYFTGAASPMPYYYFWYVLCATVVQLAHVSARQSFIASSIWAGFGLLVVLRLYANNFFRWKRRVRWVAVALLLITGADLLPALGNALLQPSINGDMEWWSVDPIDAWPDSLLWVPHHVASVLCCLLCFLLLWRTRESTTGRSTRWPLTIAALAFASSFGLSVYVAVGFAILMGAWLLRLAVLRDPDRYTIWRRSAAIAVLSGALLAPFVLELRNNISHATLGNTEPKTHFFSLSVRRMIDSELLTNLPLFAALKQNHPILLDQAIRLLLLLPGLAMELGVYGAVLILMLRQKKHHQQQNHARDTALFLAVCGLLMTLFLSSSVITNNDFGYRAVMLPQFFLLLLTADVLGSWWTSEQDPLIVPTPYRKNLLYCLLSLGAAGTLYGAVILRAWLPIESRSIESKFSQSPQEAFQIREAFSRLDKVAPVHAVIALPMIDPTINRRDEVVMPNELYQRMLVMDSGKQLLNAEWKCAIHFGGNPDACPAIRNATVHLYASPAPSAEWARGFCERFGVQYLVISNRDAVWAQTNGWPATLPVVAHEPLFEILQCR